MRLRVVLAEVLVASSVAAAAVAAAAGPAASGRARWTAKDALRIDLGDPDPSGLDLLPGISEEEVATIAGVAGPGSPDLEERLSQTGLPTDRLREWVPYLALPSSSDFAEHWAVSSATRWGGGRGIDSRMRVAFRIGNAQGSGQIRGMPERADPAASVVVATPACAVTAGSIACGIGGGDPWVDPIGVRGSRSTTIPTAVLRSGEKPGSRGVAVGRPSIGGLAVWRGPADSRGFAVAVDPARGIGITGGGTERAGVGLAVRFAVGEAAFRSILRVARGTPPAFVLDAAARGRSRGRLRIAWSLGPRRDGLQGRVEGVALGRIHTLRWTATASVLGPGRPGRSSFLGDFDVERVGRHGATAMSIACGARPSSRLAFGRPVPIRGRGSGYLGGSIDAACGRRCRVRLRLAYDHGIVRIEGSGPAFDGSRGEDRLRWSWTLSCAQAGGK